MKKFRAGFFRIFAFPALAVAVGGIPYTTRAERAQTAPAFDLPLINGYGYQSSGDLFRAHKYTFLVFWDSSCPHCVESLLQCEAFYERQTSDDVAIVGIHADQGDQFEVQQLLDANGIVFPQLWDLGGETGQNYGISYATFTLFLVDGGGRIIAHRPDPKGDMEVILEEMMASETGGAPEPERPQAVSDGGEKPAPAAPPARFVFRGNLRTRFLAIDARGAGAAGPYGEAVQPGNSLLYRFEFETSRKITRHLRAGGLLRISNEGEKVLASGPKYLGSEWGSAFAEMNLDGSLLRIGYYDISMTPLTLMRWDWEDNPRIGGNAGCGCAASAGILLVESLEELDTDLVFEGGVASYRRSNFEARAFYAIPRRAIETTAQEHIRLGRERARYSLELYGFESLWRRHDVRTGSSWKAGVHLAGSWEDRRSVDFDALGYGLITPDPWHSSTIVSADLSVPVVYSLDIEGEWILWNKADDHRAACCDTIPATTGKGGKVGVVFERSPGWNLRCDYVYLNHDFYSPFAALSYQPNRVGFRFSAAAPIGGETAAVSLFYKRLRELETPDPGAEKEHDSVFGTSFDLELPSGLGGSVGWLDNGTWRSGELDRHDEVRKALVVEARYRFNKASLLQIQYQRVDGTVIDEHGEADALTNLYSVYLSTRF
jgi:hypothetical protein